MLTVYHYPLCPFSRKLRLILKEKKLKFQLILEKYWDRRYDFLLLDPAGETPVILRDDGSVLSGRHAFVEFLEESFPEVSIFPKDPIMRFKVRRIAEWFDIKFYDEVTQYIFSEKVLKVISSQEGCIPPNSAAIRAAKKNLVYHLDYIHYLLQDNQYLCGDRVTLADYAASAQISVMDYVGDIPWDYNHTVKEWYALVKSRPSFKAILTDEVPGIFPPHYYSDPDF